MIISLIAAMSTNRVIGKDNDLVWNMPTDMAFFSKTTKGHCVITGRKNYESIPEKYKPLPNRTNIVVTHQKNYNAPGAKVCHSIPEAIQLAKNLGETEVFIIGGGEIYRQSVPLAHKIYLTKIHHHFEGDAFFPSFEQEEFILTKEEHHSSDEKNPYDFTFCTFVKK